MDASGKPGDGAPVAVAPAEQGRAARADTNLDVWLQRAAAYGDQNERDHQALADAAEADAIAVEHGV